MLPEPSRVTEADLGLFRLVSIRRVNGRPGSGVTIVRSVEELSAEFKTDAPGELALAWTAL